MILILSSSLPVALPYRQHSALQKCHKAGSDAGSEPTEPGEMPVLVSTGPQCKKKHH